MRSVTLEKAATPLITLTGSAANSYTTEWGFPTERKETPCNRAESRAAGEMTVQADIKVGPATSGHAFNLTNVGLRIADGTTIWGARVHADRVEDRNDTSKSVSVDFTSGFHTVAISKTAGGAALYVDGQYAFDLTGAAGSTNEVVFGLVDNLADRTGRAWFDNVAIRPDALD